MPGIEPPQYRHLLGGKWGKKVDARYRRARGEGHTHGELQARLDRDFFSEEELQEIGRLWVKSRVQQFQPPRTRSEG